MSQGGTFIRPGAVGWGAWDGPQPVTDRTTPAAIEHVLAAAVKDPDRVTDLLDELSRGRLWVPLPDDRPVTDGSAVLLPTVTYLGAEFVPAFTSARRLANWLGAEPQTASLVPAQSQGERGLVISVALDDPAQESAHELVLNSIERAVQAVPELGFPIDVTLPGEGAPDQVEELISACAKPFYIRARDSARWRRPAELEAEG